MYTAYYYRLTNYITVKRKEITDFHIYSRDIYAIHYNEKTMSASFLYKSAIQLYFYEAFALLDPLTVVCGQASKEVWFGK